MFDNPMRVTGLASGMDIDSMVDKLMKAERMPLDKMQQQQKTLEWKRDDYREMNKLLKEFDQNIFDGIFRESTFLTKTVTSTNDAAVTAAAAGLINNTTTQISVSQLAKAATAVSGKLSTNNSFDPDAVLSSQTAYLNSSNFGTEFKMSVLQADGTMKEKVFNIDASADSLNDVLQRINGSDLGVTAFYDKNADQISIASNHTGNNKSDAEISVNEVDGTLFSGVFQFGPADAAGNVVLANNGQNAEFTLNGLTTERTSNTFTINDMTYTLKQTTAAAVTISTATDTDSIYDSVKSFVDKYNETIEKMNDKLNEDHYRDYPPLTDAQRDALSDHEIELWEEKAQSGMLYNDSILPGGLSELRLDMYGKVEGANINEDLNQLSELGIVTSSDYREHGKLVIKDPTKLRQAIEDNPEAVYKLFNKDGDSFETKGIAERLRDTIANTMERIELKAGNTYDTEEEYTIGEKLKSNENQIDDFKRRLEQIQSRYYRQFSTMEQAIQRANQQSVFITNQFSGGQ